MVALANKRALELIVQSELDAGDNILLASNCQIQSGYRRCKVRVRTPAHGDDWGPQL